MLVGRGQLHIVAIDTTEVGVILRHHVNDTIFERQRNRRAIENTLVEEFANAVCTSIVNDL